MPELIRPDGAVIHYEVFGSGYPFLLLAPGGVNSQIDFWEHSAVNPITEFSDDFMVIGMDQRYAGKSLAPLTPFSYEQALGDQLAVLDELGVASAHVMGGCIGCAYALNLLDQAPARISAAVLQDPVGLDESNSMDTFYDMFNDTIRVTRAEGLDGVIAAALEQPIFMMKNAGGPWAQRLHDDEEFRAALLSLRREAYIALVVDFRDGIWPPGSPYFTVNELAVQRIADPILVLPGSDAFHPTGIARKICADAQNAHCLDVDARSAEKLPATIEAIRAFLHENTPAAS